MSENSIPHMGHRGLGGWTLEPSAALIMVTTIQALHMGSLAAYANHAANCTAYVQQVAYNKNAACQAFAFSDLEDNDGAAADDLSTTYQNESAQFKTWLRRQPDLRVRGVLEIRQLVRALVRVEAVVPERERA